VCVYVQYYYYFRFLAIVAKVFLCRWIRVREGERNRECVFGIQICGSLNV